MRDDRVDYEAERVMAFKRITEKFYTPRRRRREMLKWHEEHPSQLTEQDQLRNLKRVIWD